MFVYDKKREKCTETTLSFQCFQVRDISLRNLCAMHAHLRAFYTVHFQKEQTAAGQGTPKLSDRYRGAYIRAILKLQDLSCELSSSAATVNVWKMAPIHGWDRHNLRFISLMLPQTSSVSDDYTLICKALLQGAQGTALSLLCSSSVTKL